MWLRVLTFGLLLIVSAPWARGQTPQTDRPPPPTQPGTSRRPEKLPSVIFLSGRVVLEDGSPPLEPVQVRLVCDGIQVRQVSTQGDGTFAVEVGSHRPPGVRDSPEAGPGLSGLSRDASGRLRAGGIAGLRPAGPGRVDMSSCQFRIAPSAGYRMAKLPLGIRRVYDNPDVGQIVLGRSSKNRATSVSLNTLAAPENARNAYDKAKVELEKNEVNYKKVTSHLKKAVKAYPEFAAAWSLLGQTRVLQGDKEQARSDFHRAIDSDADFTRPYLDLARLELRDKRWKEAASFAGQVIEQNAMIPESHYILGVAKYYLKETEQAETSFRTLEDRGAIELYPMSLFLLGMIEARQGKIPRAADHFRIFLDVAPSDVAPETLRDRINGQLRTWVESGQIDQP